MELVNQISAGVLSVGDKVGEALGLFFIPVILLGFILLLWFAAHSYKSFRIVLPFCGIVIGAYIGANFIAPLLSDYAPAVAEYVNPYYIPAILLAAVLALLFCKSQTLSVVLIGAFVGYTAIGRLAKDILLSIPFVYEIATSVERIKSFLVGVLVCVVCMIATAYIVHKFFKYIYVVVTAVGASVAAFTVSAILIFENTASAGIAAVIAAGLGLIYGISCCHKQFYDIEFY